MSTPSDPREEKIIVDEDWKSRVQREKEELRQKQAPQDSGQPSSGPADAGPLPPPTLSLLITTLGLQATAALGLAPNPLSGKVETDLAQAKHLIDMLQMLQEKTKGNRTEEESAILDELLHQLRMGYVARVQHPA